MDFGACNQTPLHPPSQYLTHTRDTTASSTCHLDSKRSQDIFQMYMDHRTNSLPGFIAIHGDICIYGKTTEEHDKDLLQLMETASQNSFIFNSSKCSIRQPQITFYGPIFTAQRLKPDPAKYKHFKTFQHQKLKNNYNHFRSQQLFTTISNQLNIQNNLPI